METKLATSLGDALRAARKAKGLTQEDAAERVGISPPFYARMERGATLPSVPTLARLATALGVGADVLLGLVPGRLEAVASEAPASWPAIDAESADVRRLVRRLRRARPRTVRLLAILAAELERGADGSSPPRGAAHPRRARAR